MRLTYPEPPGRIRELAYKALNMEMLRHPHEEHHGLRHRSNAFGHVPDLHKVFLLSAKAVGEGKGLKAARHAGWYDIVVLSGMSHGIEVAEAEGNDPTAYVLRGASTDQQIALLTALVNRPDTDTAEVRVLKIPPIAAFAFWLHRKRAEDDRLMPVIASARQLEIGKEYRPKEFFASIRAIAKSLTSKSSGRLPARKRRSSSRAAGARPQVGQSA
jgi:hypothetical protein